MNLMIFKIAVNYVCISGFFSEYNSRHEDTVI